MIGDYHFKNLAGDKTCDDTIRVELELVGLRSEKALAHRDEVPYTIYGKYKNFTFTRAWRYWIVTGGLVESRAKVLNTDKYCKENVRVSGWAGGISNEELSKRISHFSLEGKEELLQAEYDKYLEEYSDPESSIHDTILNVIPQKYQIVPEYSQEGVISVYHIDTLLGLKKFVDFIKEEENGN